MTNDLHETVLTNARIVLEDEVILGTLQMRDGLIGDVCSGRSSSGEDMENDYLVPGLVELHTDHLEGHYAPRPKVRWNPAASVLAHDAQLASSGVTTVFDALRVGMDQDADMTFADMQSLAGAIDAAMNDDSLRADHFLHVRCEVSAANCLEEFRPFMENRRVRLASLMDHAPGQRQFARIEAYQMYYQGKLKMDDEEFARFCAERKANSAAHSDRNRKAIAALCHDNDIIVASHDDATIAHVNEALEQGIRVAEFPTTVEAARASHENGLAVLMGAPNVVRGSSHSGNVAARDLAEQGYLDILSSDYIPYSLIHSAFFLGDEVDGISLPDAVNMVSRNPARSIGMADRGVIAKGKRADLVRVRHSGDVPVVRTVWREGRRVA